MKTKLIHIFLALITISLMSSCGQKPEEEKAEKGSEAHDSNVVTLSKENLEHIDLKTEKVKLQNLDMTLKAPGRVHLDQNKTAHILPTLEGRITKLTVELNQKLKTGDLLASIESPELLGRQLQLRAPVDGTVISRVGAVGELADKTNDLITISDLSSLWVIGEVREKDISAVKVGQPATFKVLAYPDKEFEGMIVLVGNEVDEGTRTLEVRIQTNNKESLLKPGMFADVSIVTTVLQNTLVISDEALQTDGNNQVVFVEVAENRFEKRQVQTGQEQGGRVQIYSGLKAGDEVVTKGSFVFKSELLKGELGEE